jgi:hypothetical protein
MIAPLAVLFIAGPGWSRSSWLMSSNFMSLNSGKSLSASLKFSSVTGGSSTVSVSVA